MGKGIVRLGGTLRNVIENCAESFSETQQDRIEMYLLEAAIQRFE